MKKIIALFLSSFLFSGCQTIANVDGNDFITAVPAKVDESMIGFWVGASGPYLNTIKINNNGSGEFCYSWNNNNAHGKLIFDGRNIIYQSGEKLEVNSLTANSFIAKANYYMGSTYKFYKDDNLIKSSTFCQNLFSGT